MGTVCWLVGLGLPVAWLLFMFGYSKGFDDYCTMSNWGTGFDDGWEAYEKLMIENKEDKNAVLQDR